MCIEHAEEALCKLQGSFNSFFLRWFTYINIFKICYDSIKPNVRLIYVLKIDHMDPTKLI